MIRFSALVAVLAILPVAPVFAQTLVWEDEFADGAALSGASITSQDVQVDLTTQVVSDEDSGALDLTTFPGKTSFFEAEHTQQGAHAGYAFLGFDNNAADTADYLEISFLFASPVVQLSFSLLDVDERAIGAGNDFDDAVVVTYNGAINVVGTSSLYTLGPNVEIGDEGFGEFEGFPHAGTNDASTSGSTDSNIDFDFGLTEVSSLTIRYFSTDDTQADPRSQLMGISDLVWVAVPEPNTGLLVGLGLVGLARRRPRRS